MLHCVPGSCTFNIMAPEMRLRKYRDANGLTRTDLAYKLGCSYDMVRSIECGRRKPGRELAAKIEHLTYLDDRIEALDW